MSEATSRKSQGMRFAEEQLQRHGWTEGKGLGKRESGISKAIKVKVKCDKAGVGHDSAEQFTFHWWDHVFNKTAASISVEADQDGVQVKKMKEGDCTVTNKKPRKALARNNMLYGRFIKSATLLSGGEAPGVKPSSSESSDTEDEDEKLDLSSATKMTDEDLIKVCGGRTAHKGARHGLTMSAKLSRLEEQERAFLEKYGKKEDKKKTEPKGDDSVRPKKHKKKKNLQEVESDPGADIISEPVKRKDTPDEEEAGHNCHYEAEESRAEGRKNRKKHRRQPESPEEPTDQDKEPMDSEVKVKKKKKSKKE